MINTVAEREAQRRRVEHIYFEQIVRAYDIDLSDPFEPVEDECPACKRCMFRPREGRCPCGYAEVKD